MVCEKIHQCDQCRCNCRKEKWSFSNSEKREVRALPAHSKFLRSWCKKIGKITWKKGSPTTISPDLIFHQCQAKSDWAPASCQDWEHGGAVWGVCVWERERESICECMCSEMWVWMWVRVVDVCVWPRVQWMWLVYCVSMHVGGGVYMLGYMCNVLTLRTSECDYIWK